MRARQAASADGPPLCCLQARVLMERELAAAQQQAAARALVVAKEKAANEAKSEFMSLMCHEVRTPLNGCLASAEMLLDTELSVSAAACCRRLLPPPSSARRVGMPTPLHVS